MTYRFQATAKNSVGWSKPSALSPPLTTPIRCVLHRALHMCARAPCCAVPPRAVPCFAVFACLQAPWNDSSVPASECVTLPSRLYLLAATLKYLNDCTSSACGCSKPCKPVVSLKPSGVPLTASAEVFIDPTTGCAGASCCVGQPKGSREPLNADASGRCISLPPCAWYQYDAQPCPAVADVSSVTATRAGGAKTSGTLVSKTQNGRVRARLRDAAHARCACCCWCTAQSGRHSPACAS